MTAITTNRRRNLQLGTALATCIACAGFAQVASAQTLPDVANPGGADISSVGGVMTVDINNANRVIQWNSFSVGQNDRVNFVSSNLDPVTPVFNTATPLAVLNRVTGTERSDILGTLNAQNNIQVWLANPNGIVFGANSTFSGGSLVLTTLVNNIQTAFTNSLAGNETRLVGNSTQAIRLQNGSNLGTGSGAGRLQGNVLVVAKQIQAGGEIAATGNVGLVAAADVTFAAGAGSPLQYTINSGTNMDGVEVLGTGELNGASVVVGAMAQGAAVDQLLQVRDGAQLTATATGAGVVLSTRANGVAATGGNDDGIVVDGTLTTSGAAAAPVTINADGALAVTGTIVSNGDASLTAATVQIGAAARITSVGALDVLATASLPTAQNGLGIAVGAQLRTTGTAADLNVRATNASLLSDGTLTADQSDVRVTTSAANRTLTVNGAVVAGGNAVLSAAGALAARGSVAAGLDYGAFGSSIALGNGAAGVIQSGDRSVSIQSTGGNISGAAGLVLRLNTGTNVGLSRMVIDAGTTGRIQFALGSSILARGTVTGAADAPIGLRYNTLTALELGNVTGSVLADFDGTNIGTQLTGLSSVRAGTVSTVNGFDADFTGIIGINQVATSGATADVSLQSGAAIRGATTNSAITVRSARDVTLDAATDISMGTIRGRNLLASAGTPNLVPLGRDGSMTLTDAQMTGNIALNAWGGLGGGEIRVGKALAGVVVDGVAPIAGTLTIDNKVDGGLSGNITVLDTLQSVGTLTLTSTNDILVASFTGTGTTGTVTSTAGAIAAQADGSVLGYDLVADAAVDPFVITQGGIAGFSAGGNLTVNTAAQSDVTVGTLDAGGTLIANIDGNLYGRSQNTTAVPGGSFKSQTTLNVAANAAAGIINLARAESVGNDAVALTASQIAVGTLATGGTATLTAPAAQSYIGLRRFPGDATVTLGTAFADVGVVTTGNFYDDGVTLSAGDSMSVSVSRAAQITTATAGQSVGLAAGGVVAGTVTAVSQGAAISASEGSLTLGTGLAGTGFTVQKFAGSLATAGDELRFGAITGGTAGLDGVSGDVRVFSQTNVRGDQVTALGGNALVRSGFDPNTGIFVAPGEITGLAGGKMGITATDLGDVPLDGNIATLSGALSNFGTLQAARDISVAGGLTDAAPSGAVRIDLAQAGNDLYVSNRNSVDASPSGIGFGSLGATTGSVTLITTGTNGGDVSGASIAAGLDTRISANDIRVNTIGADRNVALFADAGLITDRLDATGANITAGASIAADAGLTIRIAAATATDDLALRAGGTLTATTITAGDDVSLTGANVRLGSATSLATGSDAGDVDFGTPTLIADPLVNFAGSVPTADGAQNPANVGGNVFVTATTGDVTGLAVNPLVTPALELVTTGNALSAAYNGANLTARGRSGNVVVAAANGGAQLGTVLQGVTGTGNGTVSVLARAASADAVTSTSGNVSLAATEGTLVVGTVSAFDTATLSKGGAAATAGNDLRFTSVTGGQGGTDPGRLTTFGAENLGVFVTSATNVLGDAVVAQLGGARVIADAGRVGGRSGTALNIAAFAAPSEQNITVRSGTAIDLGTVTGRDRISVIAGATGSQAGRLDVGTASSTGGSIYLTAVNLVDDTARDVTYGALTANNGEIVAITSGANRGGVNGSSAFAGTDVSVDARNMDLGAVTAQSGAIMLNAADGVAADSLTAGTAIAGLAGGAISVGTASAAAGDVAFRAGGVLTVGTTTASDDVLFTGGSVRIGTATAQGGANVGDTDFALIAASDPSIDGVPGLVPAAIGLAETAGSSIVINASLGDVTGLALDPLVTPALPLVSTGARLSSAYGAANLTAAARDSSVSVSAGGGAQLGVVQQGTLAIGSGTGNVTIGAGAISADTVTANTGAIGLTASVGTLIVGTGSAATTATLVKQGGSNTVDGDDLRVIGAAGVTAGTGLTATSSTHVRATQLAAGTGLTVTATSGDVSGIKTGTAALLPLPTVTAADQLSTAYGKADLETDGGNLTVTATSGSAQIGTLVAGAPLAVASVTARAISADSVSADLGSLSLTATRGTMALGSVSALSGLATLIKQGGDASVDGDELRVIGAGVRAFSANVTSSTHVRGTTFGGMGSFTITALGGDVSGIKTGTAGVLPLPTVVSGSQLSAAYGRLDIGATGVNSTVSVSAAGSAQLGTLAQFNVEPASFPAGTGSIQVVAEAISADVLRANAGFIDVTARSGTLVIGTAQARAQISLTKMGGAVGTVGDEVRFTTLTSGLGTVGDVSVTSQTHIRGNAITAGRGDVDLQAGFDTTSLATTQAGEITGLAFTPANGNGLDVTTGTSAGADGLLQASSGGRAQFGTLNTAGDISVVAGGTATPLDGAIRIGTAQSGGSIYLTNKNAGTSISDIGFGTLRANGDVVLITSTGNGGDAVGTLVDAANVTMSVNDVRVGTIASRGNVALKANGAGLIDIDTITASGGIAIDAGTTIELGTAEASLTDVALRAGGGIDAGSITAADDVSLTGSSVRVATILARGTGSDTSDVTFAGTSVAADPYNPAFTAPIPTVAGAKSASSTGGNIFVAATAGDVNVTTSATAQASALFGATGAVAIQTGTATTGSLGILAGGDVSSAVALTAGEDLAIRSGGAVQLAGATAGDDLTAQAVGRITIDTSVITGLGLGNTDVTFGTAPSLPVVGAATSATNTLALTSTGADVVLGQVTIASSGANAVTLIDAAGTIAIVRDLAVQGDLRIVATGDILLGGDDARSQAATGLVSVTAGGTIAQGAGRLALRSNSDGLGAEGLTLTANRDVALGNADLTGGPASQSAIAVTATSGAITFGTVTGAAFTAVAGTNFTANGAITAGTVALGADGTSPTVSITALNGAISATTIDAAEPGRDVALTATGGITVDRVTAARSIVASGGTVLAANTLTATSGSIDGNAGTIGIGSSNSGGATLFTSGSDISVDLLIAGTSATVNAGTSATLTEVRSGGASSVSTGTTARIGTLTAGAATTIAAGTDATLGTITSTGPASITTGGAVLQLINLETQGALFVQAGTDATLGALTVAGPAQIATVAGAIGLDSLISGSDATLTAATDASYDTVSSMSGSVTVASGRATIGGLLIAANNARVTAGTSAALTEVRSGGASNIASGSTTGIDTLTAGGTTTIAAGTDATLGTITSTGAASITTRGAVLQLTKLDTLDALTVQAGTDATLGALTVAGTTQIATVSGAIMLDSLVAGGDAALTAATDATFGTITSTGGSAAVTSGGATIGGLLNAAATASVNAGSSAALADVRSGGASSIVTGTTARIDTLTTGGTTTIAAGTDATLGTITSTGAASITTGGAVLQLSKLDTQGALSVQGGTDVTLGALTATGSTQIGTGNGAIVLDSLVAGGDAALTAATNATYGTITSTGGSAAVTSGGATIGGLLNAAVTASVNAGSSAALTEVRSGGASNIATGTTARIDTLNAGGTTTIAAGTDATLGAVTSTGAASITTGGAVLQLTKLDTQGALSVQGGTNAKLGALTAAGSAQIETLSGEILLDSLVARGDAALTAATSATYGTMTSTGGSAAVTSGGATIGGLLNAAATAHVNAGTSAALTDVRSGGAARITTGTTVRIDALTSGGTTTIAAGTDATLGTINSTGAASITTGGAVLQLTRLDTQDALSVQAGTDATLGALTVARDAQIETGSGAIVLESLVAEGNAALTAATNATYGTITSLGGRAVVTSGGAIAGGLLNAATTASVNAGTSAALTDVRSGGASSIATGTTARIDTLTAGGVTIIAAGTDATLGTIISNGAASITTGGAVLQLTRLDTQGPLLVQAGTDATLGVLSVSGDATITTGGSVLGLTTLETRGALRIEAVANATLGALSSTGVSQITTRTGALTLGSLTSGAAATLNAGTDLSFGTLGVTGNGILTSGAAMNGTTLVTSGTATLTAGSSAAIGSLTSGGAASVTTGTTARIDQLASGAATTVRAGTDATLGTVTSAGDAAITAKGTLTLNGAFNAAGRTVTLTAKDATVAADVTAATIRVVNDAGAGNRLVLGEGAAGTGFALSTAEIGHFKAASTLILDAASAPVKQDVSIGALSLAGPPKVLILADGTRVDVNGRIGVSGATTALQIGGSAENVGLASVLRVIAKADGTGGSIAAPSAAVSLRAVNIAFGQSAGFLSGLGVTDTGTGDTTAAVEFNDRATSTLYFSGTNGGAIYTPSTAGVKLLTADRLTLSYTNFALFQNTGVQGLTTGVDVGSFLTVNATGTRPVLGLFGTLAGRDGTAASLLGSLAFDVNLNDIRSARVNGCIIGEGAGCISTLVFSPVLAAIDAVRPSLFTVSSDYEVPFNPLIGTNNDALFGDVGTSGLENIPLEPIECSDPTNPQCPTRNKEAN